MGGVAKPHDATQRYDIQLLCRTEKKLVLIHSMLDCVSTVYSTAI